MKVAKLIKQIQRSNPTVLSGITEDKAEEIVTNVFKQINKTLSKTEAEIVRFVGLGRFRAKTVEKEINGKTIAITRFVYRPEEPGEGKGKNRNRADSQS